jgi:transposase-like protein
MGKRKVDPQVKRDAILRIKAGSSTYREEAKRLGITPPALHEVKKKMDAREAAEAPPPSAPAAASQLDKALGAAGLGTKVDVSKPPTPEELKLAAPQALQLDADYCVGTLTQIKTVGTCGGAVLMGVPIFDERVFKAGKLGKTAEEAVRTAAPELAPLLRKYLPDGSSLVGLAIVLVMDFAGTYGTLRELRTEYQKKSEEAEKAAPPEAAPVPKPPPPTRTESTHYPEGWMANIKPAPEAA